MSANPLFKKKPQKIEDLPKEKFPLIVFRSFKGCQALCSSASKKQKKTEKIKKNMQTQLENEEVRMKIEKSKQ